jgi:phospholipid/cholesterol/gamma-HCH transport system substrate-binding protein
MLKETNQFVANLNKDNNADQGAVFRLLYNSAEVSGKIDREVEQIDELIKGLNNAIKEYQDPDSILVKMIDPSGDNLLGPIKEVIHGLNSNLKETQQLLEFLNRQKPEISTMLNHINTSMDKAQKTIDALNNNPLLKSGIPKQNQPSTGTGYRIKELPNE